MRGADGGGRTPLDDVDHLARSPHRAQVIRLFAQGDWTRRDLHDETSIPQPTLGRILGSFQDRSWLERHGQTYSLTLRGRLIATHFEGFLDVVETVQELPASANLDPLVELGFETDWLARMEVATADDDPYTHIQRARESVKSSARIRELSPGPLPGMAEVIADRLQAGELTVETVFPRVPFESFVDDPEDRSLIVDMLETGKFRLHLFDGPVPCYIARHGEWAAFHVNSEVGTPIAFLRTTETPALEWVDSVVDDYRERAEPVTADGLRA